MPVGASSQTSVLIGVDVGGTFTDLVASDGHTLTVVKVPSTPPNFERGVIDAVAKAGGQRARIVHGSTVATNALLQRAGARVAFITTEGFEDMLLIGRQNRAGLYDLHVTRPMPITQDVFGVHERISATGEVNCVLDEAAVTRAIDEIKARGIAHIAVCLLFSFVNDAHERHVARMCRAAGLTVSLSSDILPEFREYERASTTAINASLRPIVETYLTALRAGLNDAADLSIMHGSGGTLTATDAGEKAVRLVLSGPAGGILGAAFVAGRLGFDNVITYDMGGTSTDVAVIVAGAPQWTTRSVIDGLPIGIPMFDIHTVGAGGGSIAEVDTGGALRVGPRSAGAQPGPACYACGGSLPTVTDANLVLGRISAEHFLGGAMTIRKDLAQTAIAELAAKLGKSVTETALGIVKVAEANMEGAIRAVTSRRGHDPRAFTLMSFGGAAGLHACAIAEGLDIQTVLIPPCAGVLSALGMVVAPPVAESSKTVVQLKAELDDARLAAEYGQLSGRTMDVIPYEQTASVEAWADVRFAGQSHELQVRTTRPAREEIEARFLESYTAMFGRTPTGKAVEIVTLRIRRIGRRPELQLPKVIVAPHDPASDRPHASLIDADGRASRVPLLERQHLSTSDDTPGPFLLIDAQSTAYIPRSWQALARDDGAIILTRKATS